MFARQREGADRLARQLERLKYSVATLHERKSQTERERAMEDLKRGRLQIVVTTDIAARGLELIGVSHVVNFDVPPTPEDYVHRIGRAGRPDAQGDAFTLMAVEEQRHLAAIERFVGRAIPRVLLPDFDYKLKPEQVQQSVIFDDERIRERHKKAIAARMPYAASRAAAPARPGGAAGLARPSAGIPRSVSKPPAVPSNRPRPTAAPTTAKVRPRGISVKVTSVAKPVAKPVAKAVAKPVAKTAHKPAAKHTAPRTKK